MSTDFSFQLGLINSCLGLVANILAWFLTTWFARRTIYLYGVGFSIFCLIGLGVAATVEQNSSTNYAQACLGIIVSFAGALALGPVSFTIIAETSSVRLRALSTGVGRAAYYVAEIPMIYREFTCLARAEWSVSSQLLNPTGWNVAGKCGYVWAGTATVCFVIAYFFLPEMKHRSYREIDVLFARRVPARKFRETIVDIADNH